MKVLYLLHSTNILEGSTKSFMTLLSAAMKRGVEPVVVLPDCNGIYESICGNGIKAYTVNCRLSVYPPSDNLLDILLFIPRLLFHSALNLRAKIIIRNIIVRERPDIIHTNVSVLNLAYSAAQSMKIPHVIHIREFGDLDFNMKYLPSYKSFSDYLKKDNVYSVCITKSIQRHHHVADSQNSWVVYNGICSAKDIALDNEKEDFFLFAGRIKRGKGLLDLVNAYIKYVEANKMNGRIIPLHIYGEKKEMSYFSDINKIITRNNAGEYVKYCGVTNDIGSVMRKAKAIIIPSKFEAFGRCMAEAMFNGCFCIGHDTAGTKEQFDNGLMLTGKEIGLRYNTEDELVDCLNKVTSCSIDDMMPYITASQKVVSELYSNEANIQQILDIYNKII